ncbi:MAG: hypothetical protein PHS93_07995 [Candidatus Omnitrophica bacterium]|nr:hypothetical protein [Candidatus Omnitrophota bacterium]
MIINKMYKNKKTGKIYYAMFDAIDCTNKDDGQKMIIYSDGVNKFTREENEFNEKFEVIK